MKKWEEKQHTGPVIHFGTVWKVLILIERGGLSY